MIAGRIKSKYIVQDIRFNGGYFLNEDAVNSRALEENGEQCSQLTELADVWNPPIFKRQFCQETERAIPYCQSSDVTNALEGSDVYINKIQANKVGSVVEENQILITGFGTIGNTRLVNELSTGISYANNVCRVKANEGVLHGYLYAVLTSKYGRSQLNKNASGSVVRYIEAPGIKKTLIPNLPDSKQEEIHNLIVEASNLRVEANKLLRKAQNYYLDEFDEISKKSKTGEVKFSYINLKNRLNSNFFLSEGENYENQILAKEHYLIEQLSNSIFTSGREKRDYVKDIEKGKYFFSNTDLSNSNPYKSASIIRKSKIKNESLISGSFLLTGRVGSVGDINFPFNFLINHIASDNVIRIDFKSHEKLMLAFAFLSTIIGRKIIFKRKSGTNQPFITESMLLDIPIPKLNPEREHNIVELISEFKRNTELAFQKENKAIDLVEKEIESWQK